MAIFIVHPATDIESSEENIIREFSDVIKSNMMGQVINFISFQP